VGSSSIEGKNTIYPCLTHPSHFLQSLLLELCVQFCNPEVLPLTCYLPTYPSSRNGVAHPVMAPKNRIIIDTDPGMKMLASRTQLHDIRH